MFSDILGIPKPNLTTVETVYRVDLCPRDVSAQLFKVSISGKFEFELAFDLNQRDAEGQTVLYLATCVGNLKIVELLLGFRVKGRRSREVIQLCRD